jgi:hypothetical protein
MGSQLPDLSKQLQEISSGTEEMRRQFFQRAAKFAADWPELSGLPPSMAPDASSTLPSTNNPLVKLPIINFAATEQFSDEYEHRDAHIRGQDASESTATAPRSSGSQQIMHKAPRPKIRPFKAHKLALDSVVSNTEGADITSSSDRPAPEPSLTSTSSELEGRPSGLSSATFADILKEGLPEDSIASTFTQSRPQSHGSDSFTAGTLPAPSTYSNSPTLPGFAPSGLPQTLTIGGQSFNMGAADDVKKAIAALEQATGFSDSKEE